MNLAYDTILSADDEARSGLFTATAQRIGTTPQNVEKDFRVCWTLDALFNGIPEGPRLLFKGGTSLSKGFGLIRRFSEDIDVTVFRDDLGETHSIEGLQKLSGKKREAALNAIRKACEAFINGPMLTNLTKIAAEASERNGVPAGSSRSFRTIRTSRPCWFDILPRLKPTPIPQGREDRNRCQVSARPQFAPLNPPLFGTGCAGPRPGSRARHDRRCRTDVLGQGRHPARTAALV